jgi:hypothetical protein
MSSRLLKRVGEALYGPRWQSEVARDLEVSDRTVRRWVDGSYDVPDGVYLDLLALCQERAAELDELVEILPRAAAPRENTK